jgi:hypothetical protein
VGDVALVPQRDVLEPGLQVAAQHGPRPLSCSAFTGLRLWGIALDPSATGGTAPRPATLGALQVADLGANDSTVAPTAHA